MSEWWLTKDGDLSCLRMHRRHYSSKKNKRPKIRQFVGPGEKLVLRTWTASAVFVWRNFIDDCIDERTGERQQGINCAMFRNESAHQSSELIRQADAIADCAWPSERHYTYVDAKEVRSTNPGYCFIRAGWRPCGWTYHRDGSRKQRILERQPTTGAK